MAALTVLQLDTKFPRMAGDVGSALTYTPLAHEQGVDIRTITNASVTAVISDRPDQMDISGFSDAAAAVQTGMTVTSCGFLAYWQDHLAACSAVPIITSSLCLLPSIMAIHKAEEIAIITFNEAVLKGAFFADMLNEYAPLFIGDNIIGLSPDMHLRQVIETDAIALDMPRAENELIAHIAPQMTGIKAVLFECTNLPPYKAAIKTHFNVEVYDILTAINTVQTGLIREEYL